MAQSRPRLRAPRPKPLVQRHTSRAKARPHRLTQAAPPGSRDGGRVLIAAKPEGQEWQPQSPMPKHARLARAIRCRELTGIATEVRLSGTGAPQANNAEAPCRSEERRV